MNSTIIERAVTYARRNAEEVNEDRLRAETLVKLQGYLSEGLQDNASRAEDWVKAITDYMEGSELQRNKLLLFCERFKDPTAHAASVVGMAGLHRDAEMMFCKRERVVEHAALKETELQKIAEFIEAHKNDKTFPVVLDELMKKHEMDSPTVYRNAFMSRQAFQRVYRMGEGDNVTLKMVWQIIFGLHCTIEEADELLFSAGYARHGDYYDLTLAYLIEHRVYDVELANAALEELGLDCFNLHEHKT